MSDDEIDETEDRRGAEGQDRFGGGALAVAVHFRHFWSRIFASIRNRELEPTNDDSEGALRPCAACREIVDGFRQGWGAHLCADIRSTIETARRRAINAVRCTLNGKSIQWSGETHARPGEWYGIRWITSGPVASGGSRSGPTHPV